MKWAAVTAALGVAACGGIPTGLATIEVDPDGTVTAYLTDSAGAIVYVEGTYLQIRGERTKFTYGGSGQSSNLICEQLPTSGPLELRLTAAFMDCPEIHVAAYNYAPPVTTKADGTEVSAADVPLAQRCSTYQTLMHSTFWIPGGCEDVRSDDPDARPVDTSTTS